MFWWILYAGIASVVIQGVLAYFDGYLTYPQMQANGVKRGYSFFEHGGMWADVFIVSPLVAHLATHYRFAKTAWWGWVILVIVVVVVAAANEAYSKIGLELPVPHNHDGRITLAGYIHAIFAMICLWLVGMFYFTPITPAPSRHAIIGVSLLLTVFFPLGIIDFTPRWVFLKGAKIQLAIQIGILWAVTIVRLALQ